VWLGAMQVQQIKNYRTFELKGNKSFSIRIFISCVEKPSILKRYSLKAIVMRFLQVDNTKWTFFDIEWISFNM